MKSLYHGTVAANCKMRGKLTRGLSCMCCVLQNFTPSERVKEANKEIRDYGKEEKDSTSTCTEYLHI
jgi:hypothetical protein